MTELNDGRKTARVDGAVVATASTSRKQFLHNYLKRITVTVRSTIDAAGCLTVTSKATRATLTWPGLCCKRSPRR